ncbi:MAG: DUF1499 domain-containing protein [Pseudomonadota bacterium]
MTFNFRFLALVLVAGALATGCSDVSKPAPGISAAGTLAPCPGKPNCRCSDVAGEDHGIPALSIPGEPGAAWAALKAYVDAQPRMKVIVERDDYLHVEATTRLMRFTDDVEFHLRADNGQIAMRSESRVGYSDLGANAKRLEAVRAALADKGVVAASAD